MHLLTTLSVLALLAAILVVIHRAQYRRQMLLGALFSLPIIVLELLSAGKFTRLGVGNAGAIRYLIVSAIGMMSFGALLALAADVFINRWLTPKVHHYRHHLAWLLSGTAVAIALLFTGWSVGLSLLIGVIVNAAVVVLFERALLWDAIVGAVVFAGWYILADVLFGIRSSGDIERLLIGSRPIGLTLAGLPAERVLTAALFGSLLGPIFSATKFFRAPQVERGETTSTIKMLFGVGVMIVATLFVTLAGLTYVLPTSIQSVVAGEQSILVIFQKPINRETLTITLDPPVDGAVYFTQPTLSDHGFHMAEFVYADPLQPGMKYTVTVSGIESVWGLASPDKHFTFTAPAAPVPEPVVVTPPVVVPPPVETPVNTSPAPVTPTPVPPPAPTPAPAPAVEKHILSVAQDYQDQPLSCEAAALKMALAKYSVKVSESEIMKYVGYDSTPHQGSIWGDPGVAFVGNIAGKQNSTGYGVHWDPIGKAAGHWRTAKVLTNGTTSQLAQAILDGHPVVIWGTLGSAHLDSWKTPAGKTVSAWKGEHARTLIGFTGTVGAPVSFIINDPVVGRITWSRNALDQNWATFNRSAVIIE